MRRAVGAAGSLGRLVVRCRQPCRSTKLCLQICRYMTRLPYRYPAANGTAVRRNMLHPYCLRDAAPSHPRRRRAGAAPHPPRADALVSCQRRTAGADCILFVLRCGFAALAARCEKRQLALLGAGQRCLSIVRPRRRAVASWDAGRTHGAGRSRGRWAQAYARIAAA